MISCISLELRRSIAYRDHLREINRKEGGDTTVGLVLVNVPRLVGKDAKVEVSLANEYCVSEREADHSGAEKTGLKCGASEHWILGNRKSIDNLHSDPLRSQNSNTAGVLESLSAKRRSDSQGVIGLSLRPRDGLRKKKR